MEKEFSSDAWLMSGFIIDYTPGILSAAGGKLTFTSKKGMVFSVPLSDVKDVEWPRLQMGFGTRFRINGKKYKFTFMQPSDKLFIDTADFSSYETGSGRNHIKDFKAAAKEWREVLGG